MIWTRLVVSDGVWAGVVAGTTYAPQGPAFRPTFPTTPPKSIGCSSPHDPSTTRQDCHTNSNGGGLTLHPSQSQPVFGNLRRCDTSGVSLQQNRSNNTCATQVIRESIGPHKAVSASESDSARVSFSVSSGDESDDNAKEEWDDGIVVSPNIGGIASANRTGHLEIICPKCGTVVSGDPRRLRSPSLTGTRLLRKPSPYTRKMTRRLYKGNRANDLRHAAYQRSKSDEVPNNRVTTTSHKMSMSADGGQQQKFTEPVTMKTNGAMLNRMSYVSDGGRLNVTKRDVISQQNDESAGRRVRNSSGNGVGEKGKETEGVASLAAPKRRRRRRRPRNRQGSVTGQGDGQAERTQLESSVTSVNVHGGNPKWSWK